MKWYKDKTRKNEGGYRPSFFLRLLQTSTPASPAMGIPSRIAGSHVCDSALCAGAGCCALALLSGRLGTMGIELSVLGT